jgi:hypothetical protein
MNSRTFPAILGFVIFATPLSTLSQPIMPGPVPDSWSRITPLAQWGACELFLTDKYLAGLRAYGAKTGDTRTRLSLRETLIWTDVGIRLHIYQQEGFRQLSLDDQKAAQNAFKDVAKKSAPHHSFTPMIWDGCQSRSLARIRKLDPGTKSTLVTEAQESFDRQAAALR